MLVYIVIQNGHISAVFDNEVAAKHHRDALTLKWNITEIRIFEVLSI